MHDSLDVLVYLRESPAHLLSSARQLRWIQVTGAGVDAFLAKSQLSDSVVLTRADVSFGDQIAEYVIGHLLALTQRLRDVHHLQGNRTWHPLEVGFLKGKIAPEGWACERLGSRARNANSLDSRGFMDEAISHRSFQSLMCLLSASR